MKVSDVFGRLLPAAILVVSPFTEARAMHAGGGIGGHGIGSHSFGSHGFSRFGANRNFAASHHDFGRDGRFFRDRDGRFLVIAMADFSVIAMISSSGTVSSLVLTSRHSVSLGGGGGTLITTGIRIPMPTLATHLPIVTNHHRTVATLHRMEPNVGVS